LVDGLIVPLRDKFLTSPPRGQHPRLERVLRNLANVLNSKREYSSPLLPDFGIRTLTEFRSREAIGAAVIEDVRECIARYEPCLRLDHIELDPERVPLHLSFSLKCTLLDDPHELQISFDTVFNQCAIARR
jgi:type VI secretion system lysozyme-like protein